MVTNLPHAICIMVYVTTIYLYYFMKAKRKRKSVEWQMYNEQKLVVYNEQ